MEFKGSIGNWHFKEFFSNKIKYRFFIQNEYGDNVCKILWDDNNNIIEEKANALLISKAPEMLFLLKDLLYDKGLNEASRREVELLIKQATEL